MVIQIPPDGPHWVILERQVPGFIAVPDSSSRLAPRVSLVLPRRIQTQ